MIMIMIIIMSLVGNGYFKLEIAKHAGNPCEPPAP